MFRDYAELKVPVWFFDFATPWQFVDSELRPISDSNAFWTFCCAPNSLYLRTSLNGVVIHCEYSIKETNDKWFYHEKSKAFRHSHIKYLSNDKVQELKAVDNGIITLTCNITIELLPEKETPKFRLLVDSMAIQFSSEQLNMNGKTIIATENQPIQGCKIAEWTAECCLRSQLDYDFQVVVYERDCHCEFYAVSFVYRGLVIKNYGNQIIKKAHLNMCAQNGMITVAVESVFAVPCEELESPALDSIKQKVEEERYTLMKLRDELRDKDLLIAALKAERAQLCLPNPSDYVDFINCAHVKVTSLLLESDFGDFDGSDEKLAHNSKTVTYRIRCYHGGDRAENKGYISVYINGNAGPEGDKIITFCIRIRGDTEMKTFRLIAVNEFSLSLPKFISHNNARKLFDKDSALTVECTATCQQI